MMMDGHSTPGGKTVLDALGLEAGYIVKAKLALRIQKPVSELGLTQRQAAARMPITQPKLSQLVPGRFDAISQAKLEECLRALGHDIEVAIGPRGTKGPGR